jgi:N utilization substance protein A
MLRQEAAEIEIGQDLLSFEPLTLETAVALGRKGVKSLDDLADLSADELVELLPDGEMTEADAGQLIMAARAHWFATEGGEAGAEATAAAQANAEADAAQADAEGEAEAPHAAVAEHGEPERHA